jgi:hypothetical protein
LLGTHVGRRADGDTRAGEGAGADVGERLGDSEIRHHDTASRAVEENVVRFDVSVNDAHGVGQTQGVGRFLGNPANFLDG